MNFGGLYRHDSVCHAGLWFSNLSAELLGWERWEPWHVHAHCVVDDFGTLMPVQIEGMTATRALFNSGEWQ